MLMLDTRCPGFINWACCHKCACNSSISEAGLQSHTRLDSKFKTILGGQEKRSKGNQSFFKERREGKQEKGKAMRKEGGREGGRPNYYFFNCSVTVRSLQWALASQMFHWPALLRNGFKVVCVCVHMSFSVCVCVCTCRCLHHQEGGNRAKPYVHREPPHRGLTQ